MSEQPRMVDCARNILACLNTLQSPWRTRWAARLFGGSRRVDVSSHGRAVFVTWRGIEYLINYKPKEARS